MIFKANQLDGTVTKVIIIVGAVFIDWIASIGYEPDSSTALAKEQNPKNLKLLSCFAHPNWQVGDSCLIPIMSPESRSCSSSLSVSKETVHTHWPLHCKKIRKADETIEHGVDATTLIPIETPGDHEFVAKQYVVEKVSDVDDA
ncbi:hypothetical protein CCACVL1_11444 [Corchorus capsularis]|uniref:UBE2O-like tandem tSH3-B domain-containing protein n=1 Tax=Corchorus capsularis TaxID=210143 RepID=A0A1R3IL58_COCAP|nr:hypothetical protein CCACVL1_11444 [Corchorus capsularis]